MAGDVAEPAENDNSLPDISSSLRDMVALVVEDEEVMRHSIQLALEHQGGMKVLEASNGVEAVAILKEHKDDIGGIITDCKMPEMGGEELCRYVRQELGLKEVPVIFVSGQTDRRTVIRLFETGATDYIPKPFVLAELQARIQAHFASYQLVRDLRKALSEVKTLSGLLPICFHCKKVRDDGGYWHQIEDYISSHSPAHFSHGLCESCLAEHYPATAERLKQERQEAGASSPGDKE